MSGETIETALTRLLGIKYPILLAGMNKAAGPKLAAAVTNAGGLGVIGGLNMTPRMLKLNIKNLKQYLDDPKAPFGVDLLLPKTGTGARATNYDYTKGKLDALTDVIIESGAKLFVSAVGVPPKRVVERCHENGILVMNMVGAPKHVKYAIDAGVDIICAQGGEGGGHTGDVATSILLPTCVDLCRHSRSPLTGEPVYVVGAGGIFDGRGLASALSYGCQAVWVGTRFVCAAEASASESHKKAIVNAGYHDTFRTLAFTGRPLRIVKNKYAVTWETDRKAEMEELLKKGIIPYKKDEEKAKKLFSQMRAMQQAKKAKAAKNPELAAKKKKSGGKSAMFQQIYQQQYEAANPHLSGAVAGAISDIKPAKEIIDEMMTTAIAMLKHNTAQIKPLSKL